MRIYDPKKILIPVVLTEFGGEVLAAGLEIGRLRDADVLVLHVAAKPPILSSYLDDRILDDVLIKARENAMKNLNSRFERIVQEASPGPKVKSRLLFGYPAVEILKTAESEKVDLIVMGTRGRRGLSRMFQGSVTEEVIHRAPSPVLAIRVKRSAEVGLENQSLGQEGLFTIRSNLLAR